MPRYLVTPTLHSAWRWYMRTEADDKSEFLDLLNKVEHPPSEEMLLGRKFEADVFAECDGIYAGSDDPDNWAYQQCVQDVADQVNGGLRQQRVYLDDRISGVDVLLFGKADVIRRDWIYDIKRSRSYDIGKYIGSIQHPLYMVASCIGNFRYVISDGRSIWHEDYHLDQAMREHMRGEIAAMLDSLFGTPKFREPYEKHWAAKPARATA